MSDPVNHPPHYNQGGIECIDAISAAALIIAYAQRLANMLDQNGGAA